VISIRLFPPRPRELPPMHTCAWWIPCAVKTMRILRACAHVDVCTNSFAADEANKMTTTNAPLEYTHFYVDALDHWDLLGDYALYKQQRLAANRPLTAASLPPHPNFTFCAHAFVLSLAAKRTIMDGHSEEVMIANARVRACRIFADDLRNFTEQHHRESARLPAAQCEQHILEHCRAQRPHSRGFHSRGAHSDRYPVLIRS
jgi:hypothetical protein